ncbi:MAG: hypothetical protein ACRYGL_09895 [Janthinobacterium lividum]
MTEPTKQPEPKDTNPERASLDDDSRLDKDLEETFPASDAPATGGITKIGTDGEEKGSPKDTTTGV